MTEQQIFNKAYKNHQPRPVRDLMDLPTELQRDEVAHFLAPLGLAIDVPIMIWGWDPYTTMTVRKAQGFTWVPAAHQEPVRVMPGLSFPGLPSYDPDHPPAGSIKVSVDLVDYPLAPDLQINGLAVPKPFQWRNQPAPGPDADGPGSTYSPLPSDQLPVGAVYRGDGGTIYEKQAKRAYWGQIVEWVRLQ